MSDPIAEAAAQLAAASSSTEPVQAPEVAQSGESIATPSAGVVVSSGQSATTSEVTDASSATVDANATAIAGSDAPVIPAPTGNVLLNAAPVVDAPNVALAADVGAPEAGVAPVDGGDVLPRESHLMLLEAKIAGFRAKLANAERVALDEFEAIVGHIKAVL